MVTTTRTTLDELSARIGDIPDPEIPVLSLADLGILRSVESVGDRIVVTITPTYSGCPAMHHIEKEIVEILAQSGVNGDVETAYSPAWTTDWMSESGRRKLRAYGVAPPRIGETAVTLAPNITCPQCASRNTALVSRFGSTACKSLHRCLDCLEPFDHFKEF